MKTKPSQEALEWLGRVSFHDYILRGILVQPKDTIQSCDGGFIADIGNFLDNPARYHESSLVRYIFDHFIWRPDIKRQIELMESVFTDASAKPEALLDVAGLAINRLAPYRKFLDDNWLTVLNPNDWPKLYNFEDSIFRDPLLVLNVAGFEFTRRCILAKNRSDFHSDASFALFFYQHFCKNDPNTKKVSHVCNRL